MGTTRETDIKAKLTQINTEKDILIDGLKDLCQHHYLPFTTSPSDSAASIIHDFLKVFNSEPVGFFEKQAFFKSKTVFSIVPEFHSLNDFQNWKHTAIDSYKLLSKTLEEEVNRLFTIQAKWAKNERNNGSFSEKVIDTLNDDKKNGRIKVIIKLCADTDDAEEVYVRYTEKEKIMEFIIPKKLHDNWFSIINPIVNGNEENDVIDVKEINTPNFPKPSFPIIDERNLIDFQHEPKFRELAKNIFPFALEHSIYINSETSLLYIFSNNTEIDVRDVGLGGMFLLLNEGIIGDIKCEKCLTILNYFSRLTDALSSRLINYYQLEEVKRQATRAAIAQVMARNMSHNIGSHVLNNLTDGERLSNEENKIVICKAYQQVIPLQNDENKIIYQLAIYNHYVKCRMDYLSDVTFGIPVMHTNKKVFKELFKEFDKVHLLLEYISGLSDFKYKIIFSKNNLPITAETDFPVAFPNDLLGCQAFYNIVENVVRNTAKHNQNKEGTTEFTINFNDIQKDSLPEELKESEHQFYEVEIFDSIQICDPVTKEIKYKVITTTVDKELHERFIAENNSYSKNKQIDANTPIKEIDWLVYNQNTKINLSVLQDNKLRNSSLGLLEMEASAAYLRKLDITAVEENDYEVDFNAEIFNSKKKLNILKAINKKDCLGYRFFISKPTEFLLVGNFNLDEKQLSSIANDGVLVKAEDKFKSELDNGFVYNHQFLLYQKSDTILQVLKDRKTSISIRKLEINDIQASILKLITQNYSFLKLEEFIWREWFNNIKGTVDHINVFTSYHASYNQANKYNIAFSNHNETWLKNKADVPHNVNYLESLSSTAQSKLPNYKDNLAEYARLRNGFLTDSTKHKLFESAKMKVVVIDERIQRFSNTNYTSDNIDVPIKDIFELTNVIVPKTDKINLGAKNFSPDIISDIENFIEEEIGQCNFLLIHYSILERMYPNSKEEINKKLSSWSKSEKLRVVITSGRGKPHNLPTGSVCYVNLSPVLNVFTDTRSKYSINYLLNAARKS